MIATSSSISTSFSHVGGGVISTDYRQVELNDNTYVPLFTMNYFASGLTSGIGYLNRHYSYLVRPFFFYVSMT
jgi:hypothetical protein